LCLYLNKSGPTDGNYNLTGASPEDMENGAVSGKVIRLLLSRGAKVNIEDEDGKTPLDLAREKRDREIIALLEKAGAAQ
jgi:ankyrin repeat protein